MKKIPNVTYEHEDDVLNIWLSKKPIDYAEDKDGVIVHYTKDNKPVYIEILYAKRFFNKSKKSDWSRKTTFAPNP